MRFGNALVIAAAAQDAENEKKEGLRMVQIVIDSSADFEPSDLEQMGVICVPMTVRFGDTVYRENEDLTKEQFYSLLESNLCCPQTSQPSPYEFEQTFRWFQESGDHVVAILLSSALSGTCQGAMLAKNLCEYENCYIIDSLNATAGTRLLVEYAGRLRDEGRSAAEIVQAVEMLKTKVTLYACLDTLEYLQKGGRISGFTAAIGNVARIRPVISVSSDGKVLIPLKTLGKQSAVTHILKWLKIKKPDPNFPMYVMYTHVRDTGDYFVGKLRKAGYRIPDSHIVNVGAAIGSHIGPNAFGIAYVTVQ